MRRLVLVALVALVGLALPATHSAAAQYDGADFGALSTAQAFEGVARPRPQEGIQTASGSVILQPYEVYFGEQFARLDNRVFGSEFAPEFMVIEVKQGTFALEVADQGAFIVDPAADLPIQHVELPMTETPPFVNPVPAFVRNLAGNICTNMCLIPQNTAVQVKPGDIVIAQANGLCLWCLIKGSGPDQGSTPAAGGTPTPQPDSGLLLVFVQLSPRATPEDFSLIEAWNALSAGTPPPSPGTATPTTQGEPATMMAWAFNPPTGCN